MKNMTVTVRYRPGTMKRALTLDPTFQNVIHIRGFPYVCPTHIHIEWLKSCHRTCANLVRVILSTFDLVGLFASYSQKGLSGVSPNCHLLSCKLILKVMKYMKYGAVNVLLPCPNKT